MSVQESVQDYIKRQSSLIWRRRILRGFIRTLMFTLGKPRINGLENIPPTGGAILMMNHISALDPGLVIASVTSRFIVPMTKAEAASNWFMGPFVWWYGAFTVNRGEVDRSALFNSIELLKAGELVLIAPEGTRHASGLTEPKDGLTYVATKADSTIIPVAVTDCIDWKERLMRFRRVNMRVTFGKPFKFKTGGRARIPRAELAQMTREAMYQLAITIPDPAVRGAYSDIENATTGTLEFISPQNLLDKQPQPV